MPKQKDRHLEAPGEANRDKHVNFLAEEQGDPNPASENFDDRDSAARNSTAGADNGFFTSDENKLQTPGETENDGKNSSIQRQRPTPIDPDDTKILGDRLSLNNDNGDMLTHITGEQNVANEDDQAH